MSLDPNDIYRVMGLYKTDFSTGVSLMVLHILCARVGGWGTTCLTCTDVPKPTTCTRVMTCGEHASCYTDMYVKPSGHLAFDLGCRDNRMCSESTVSSVGIRSADTNIITCTQCCHGDLCNSALCGQTGYNTSLGTICFSCPVHSHPDSCDRIEYCTTSRMCRMAETVVNGENVFESGCETKEHCDQEAAVHTEKDCTWRCCNDSLCNRANCIQGTLGNVTPDFTEQASHLPLATDQLVPTRPTPSPVTGSDPVSGCADNATFDCQTVDLTFDICSDVQRARTACKKYCGLCNIVDGSWSAWSDWTPCDVTCNNGTKSRVRTCTDPAPVDGGLDCVGQHLELIVCSQGTCLVNAAWSGWSDWGPCSVSCGAGVQKRERTCTSPTQSSGQRCYGDYVDYQICAITPCEDGVWSYWQHWGSCSVTCDLGLRTRFRYCYSQSSLGTCPGNNMDIDVCRNTSCQDGVWAQWSGWGDCSVTCGGGIRHRSRDCDNPLPSAFGHSCIGNSEEADSCGTIPCRAETEREIAFSSKTVASITVPDGQPLVFPTISFNIGSGYDSNTGIFTTPVDGTYLFTARLCTNNKELINYAIVVDGNDVTRGVHYGSTHDCASFNTAVVLRSGNQVWVTCAFPGNQIFGDDYRWNIFSGVLLH